MELNEQQKMAVEYSGDARNILVVAGAGCGKTRTIIARTLHLIKIGTSPSRVLMLTFTNRAAREMKSRMKSELGPAVAQIQAGTFHSFCLKIMGKIPKSFSISGLNIIDTDDQTALMTLIRGRHISKKEKELNKEFPKARDLLKYYSYSRNTCMDPKEYLLTRSELDEKFVYLAEQLFNEYQEAKNARGYLDYDDLLERFAQALTEKPALKESVCRLFDEVLVDEMQDTNPLQFSILKHFSDQNVRLFCVGDPAQSIYKFRGAEFRQIYDFQQTFPESEVIQLSLNYRSYQEVLDLSNWLMERSPLDYLNTLQADRKQCGYKPLVVDFDNPFEEASWIADKILDRQSNDIPFRHFMVLVRSGFDAKSIEAEFLHREIPYCFIGGISLTKSAHVRDVISLLRIARNSNDDLAWMRYLKLWPRLGEKTAERIINSFYDNSTATPMDILSAQMGSSDPGVTGYKQTLSAIGNPKNCVAEAVKALVPVLKDKYNKWNNRLKDLKLLITVAEKYNNLSEFIDAFTLEPMSSSELEKSESEDVVIMITVHSAKGTEAPICFVANAKQGTYPHLRSYGDLDSEEEERRILYVAMTRAQNELFITRSMSERSPFYSDNNPAVGEDYFLEAIPEQLIQNEIHCWKPEGLATYATLKDIY